MLQCPKCKSERFTVIIETMLKSNGDLYIASEEHSKRHKLFHCAKCFEFLELQQDIKLISTNKEFIKEMPDAD